MFKLLIILIATQQCIDICEGFEIQPRIINGDVSNPSDFPYFANVRGSIYSCGGALISDRYFLLFLQLSHKTSSILRSLSIWNCIKLPTDGLWRQAIAYDVVSRSMYTSEFVPMAHSIGLLPLIRSTSTCCWKTQSIPMFPISVSLDYFAKNGFNEFHVWRLFSYCCQIAHHFHFQ